MKIIFLDVDGVLNSALYYSSRTRTEGSSKHEYERSQFDPRAIDLLNHLTDTTAAKIVVSSSWRLGRTIEQLRDLFDSVGIKGYVFDKTPFLNFSGLEDYHYSVPRGCEIKAWLELNKEKLGDKMSQVKYVILDDDSDMLFWQRNNYVWIDPYCGLTPNTVYKAQRILLSKQ